MIARICRLLTVCLLTGVLAGCGLLENNSELLPEVLHSEGDPVELKVYSLLPEDQFDEQIAQPIHEQYPYITLIQTATPYIFDRVKQVLLESADLAITSNIFPYEYWNGQNKFPLADLRDMMEPKFADGFASEYNALSGKKLDAYFINDPQKDLPERRNENEQRAYSIILTSVLKQGNYFYLTNDRTVELDIVLKDLKEQIDTAVSRGF